MKKIFFICGAVILLIIIIFLSLLVSRDGETKVIINAVPKDSEVFMNGEAIKNGTYYLRSGKYTFTAKKSGFKDDSQKITVGTETITVGLIPSPDSDEARNYLVNNPNVQAAREAIGGQRANQKGLKLEQQTPLIKSLPYTDITGPFSIDYGPSDTRKGGTVIIISNSSPEGRINAIKWIKQQGFDPVDMEMRFDDFTNPLVDSFGGAL